MPVKPKGAGNVGKRRVFLQARAEGRTIREAAEQAGLSERQGERLSTDPTMRAELQRMLDELTAADRRAFMAYRRRALRVAELGMAKQVELSGEVGVPARDRERLYRSMREEAAALFPGVDVAELEQAVSQLGAMVGMLMDRSGVMNGHRDAAQARRIVGG